MVILEQLNKILDFVTGGKLSASQPKFQPSDAADVMDPVVTALQSGLSAKHLKTSAFRLVSFDGVDGTGEDPDLACTLDAALEGDVVAGVLKSSDFSDASALFESVVTVEGEIQQLSLTDLSASTFIILLIAA